MVQEHIICCLKDFKRGLKKLLFLKKVMKLNGFADPQEFFFSDPGFYMFTSTIKDNF